MSIYEQLEDLFTSKGMLSYGEGVTQLEHAIELRRHLGRSASLTFPSAPEPDGNNPRG